MKYIFTESQIKKIIDNQLNEQQSSMGGSLTTSISQAVSDRSFYDGLVTKLRNQTCTVVGPVKGKPAKGGVLITQNMTILPKDSLTFKPGDEIMIQSPSIKQATVYAQNGKLMVSVAGA
jgi:hypothetical protein